jgi:hypothetical protein
MNNTYGSYNQVPNQPKMNTGMPMMEGNMGGYGGGNRGNSNGGGPGPMRRGGGGFSNRSSGPYGGKCIFHSFFCRKFPMADVLACL